MAAVLALFAIIVIAVFVLLPTYIFNYGLDVNFQQLAIGDAGLLVVALVIAVGLVIARRRNPR